MRLRNLQLKDAEYMLEWMHDPTVVMKLRTNFNRMTIEDCESFIRTAQVDTKNLHMAIVDENDEYMGTVSLKNIYGEQAEFAITVRKLAMGKGYAQFGMKEILRKGLEELDLNLIYWCVDPENTRARRFYYKSRYQEVTADTLENVGGYTEQQKKSYIWYVHTKKDEG